MNLNDSQREAVQTVHGPLLAIAGPGSGKTTVIAERIKYMILEAGVNPSNILVITFTRAAAKEMEDRFKRMTRGEIKGVTFGTFHSVFFMMLKFAYGYRSENILTEDEKYKLVKSLMIKLSVNADDEEELLSGLVGEIGTVKTEFVDIENYYSTNIGEAEFRRLYEAYEKERKRMRKLDFDDMLSSTYQLLKERPDILTKWQGHFQYILVDEFQDINRLQYEVVKMLTAPKNNIFIVGDDDQSIYRFRGAKPEIMLGFEKDYPGAKRVVLSTNYRSSLDVVEASGRLIAHNKKRFKKEISALRGYEEPVMVYSVKNRTEENIHIIRQIDKYKKEGIDINDMAVIYRTNNEGRSIASHFMNFNIPFRMKDSITSLYANFAVKDVMTYIKIATISDKRADYLRIINKPKRFISRDAFETEEVNLTEMIEDCEGKRWAADNLLQLQNDLEVISRMKPYAAVHFIRHSIGYNSYVKEYADYRHINPGDIYDALDELMEEAKKYDSFDSWFAGIIEYERKLKEKKEEMREGTEGIMLSTMHNAKGLEFSVVFIIDANEDITPHKKAKLVEDIEEERRMFYVAMTRAKKYLNIYTLKELYGKGMEESRFVKELMNS